MKVRELIKRLKKEHLDEEVVFILDENTNQYFVLENKPLRHAGPSRFIDDDGNEFTKSVVILSITENKI